MFKKILLLIMMAAVACSAQTMEQLKKTVVFVYGRGHVKDKDGKVVELDGALGTAFLVQYPEPRGGADYGFTYFVTAKHVLRDDLEGKYLDKVRIRMNNKNGTGVSFYDIPVSDNSGKLTWLDDKEDPNADIAVFQIRLDYTKIDYMVFPIKSFTSENSLKQSNVVEGDAVYLIGLMPQFTGENRNYPLVRHGYIALLSDEPIPLGTNIKEKVYALELGSWPGQSGSPVFLSLGGYRNGGMVLQESYPLLGVMLGYVKNAIPFEVTPADSVLIGDTSNVGVSFVLPASEILKVLNSKEAQKQRDDRLKEEVGKMAGRPNGVQ